MLNIPYKETSISTIDKAINEPIAITKRGKTIIYMLTPQALEDLIDGMLAEEAEKKGFASDEEVDEFIQSIRKE
jgi:hypothetical protein